MLFFITIYGIGLTVIGDRPTLPTTEARAGGCGGAGPGAARTGSRPDLVLLSIVLPRHRPTQTSSQTSPYRPTPDIVLSSYMYPRHRPIVLSQTSSYRPFCKTVIVLSSYHDVESSYRPTQDNLFCRIEIVLSSYLIVHPYRPIVLPPSSYRPISENISSYRPIAGKPYRPIVLSTTYIVFAIAECDRKGL